jgi:hypothetical protein
VRTLPLLIGLVAVMAGCGGSEEKQIRATLAADLRAFEAQDWNAICALRTPAGRRKFLRASLRPDAKTCAEAWSPGPGGNEPIIEIKLTRPARHLSGIDVDDDVARVRYDGGFAGSLRKVGGRWLID